jgi:hypothetical protein
LKAVVMIVDPNLCALFRIIKTRVGLLLLLF